MATETNTTSAASDIRDLIGPVWRRKWLILAIVVLGTVGTYIASSQREKRYRAVTQVFVSNTQVQTILAGGSSPSTERDTNDQAQLLLSRPVTQAVISRLDLRETPESLLKTVTATPSLDSNFVTVSTERTSPDQAAQIANAFVSEYIAYRARQLVVDLDAAIRRARRQLVGLPRGPTSATQRRDLLDTIQQLQAARADAPSQARQTDRATPSRLPFTPRSKRDALFAFVISLGLAIALVFVLERFDRRIKRPEDVPNAYGLPLLSTIPHTASPVLVEDGKSTVRYMLREPFRGLRTNLQLASLDRPLRRLTVTSAIPGEGKSTIVRNLALTYLEWGLNVVVVEADLRRPTLGRFFGIEPSDVDVGLTSVLTGEAELDEALVEIDVDVTGLAYLNKVRSGNGAGVDTPGGEDGKATGPRLMLLPSGATPPNPQAVLAADRTGQIIDELNERFSIMLIDTPPLLAVSDAIPFLTHSDGVILVARIGLTDRPSAQRAMEVVRRVPNVPTLGVVANDLPSEPGGGYGYGYGYGYSAKAASQSPG